MKIGFNPNELKGISFFDSYIEKAKKGEQVGGDYIYRENITEKTSTGKNGNQVTRRYKYYYITDLLKDSADKILKNIGNFFFKGKPEEVKKIENAYEKENIEKDYGADRKTWYQHVMEYFSHRDIWDKRFAKKENAEKFKKPIKQKVAEKVDNPDMETPVETTPKIKTSVEKKDKPKWKANPSLMRKVWSLYTGKDAAKEEKADEKVKEVVNEPTDDNKPFTSTDLQNMLAERNPKLYGKESDNDKIADENIDNLALQGFSKKEIATAKKVFGKNKEPKEDPNALTPEEENAVKFGFPRFMGLGQLKTVANLARNGEEKEFYRGKIKEIAGEINKLKDRWYQSYDEEKEKHFAGLHLFDASSDWYITEWDGKDEAFGYTVLNGDTEMAEWGYIDLPSLQAAHKSPFNQVEVDLYYDNSGYVEDQLEGNNQAIEVTPIEDEVDNTETSKKPTIQDNAIAKIEEIPGIENITTFEDFYNYLTGVESMGAEIKDRVRARDLLGYKKEFLENAWEEHLNRSLAMMGNQNARKFNMPENVYEILRNLVKDKIADSGITDKMKLFEEMYKKDTYFQQKLNMYGGTSNEEITGYNRKDIFDSLYEEVIGGNTNAENNTGIERTGISNSDGEILTGNNQTDGDRNGSETEVGSNGSESLHNDSESGIGLGGSGSGRDSGPGIGRLSKTEAKKIREKCREILAKPDSEITEADKDILRNYEGAGGLNEGDQTDAAVLSEFYTPRDVIKKVWEIVDKYNPNKNKKVIEPSSGTGRFAEGRDENFTLCELDETSARIAKLLHPDADVKQGAFQKLFMKNNSVQKEYKGEKYDVAVGNPPYGDYTGRYKGMGEGAIHTRYEEYFIDRTLDTLKDDGIMAFVVPSGFLRNKNSKAKEAIAKKGKLLEAWRLPKGTFSSTDVGTDIIVLRKEPGNVEDFCNNKYFEENSKHVIGTETYDGNWGSAIINLPEGKTVAEAIDMIDTKSVEVDKQIAEINENVDVKTTEEPKKVMTNYAYGDEIETPKGKGTVTGFVKKNGKTVAYKTRVNGEPVEVPAESEAEKHQNRSDAMKGNKNAEKLVHKEKVKKAKNGDTYVESVGHNMTADEFSKRFGKEVPEADLKFWKKNNWEGIVEKSSLTDAELKEIEKNKNFLKLANGDYISTVNYASGNIYKKLEDLESQIGLAEITQEEYLERKAILESVLPPKKKVENISVGVTANFAKTFTLEDGKSLVDKFLHEYCGFGNAGQTWGIKLSNHELEDNMNWNDVWAYVHQEPVRTERAISRDPDEREIEKETNKMMAEQKKQARREVTERLFNDFLRQLPSEEKKAVEDAWNKQFNAHVNPDFKKIPLFVEGMSTHKGTHEFNPTVQQMKGISELCNKGNGILAYDVGVGKTFCGIVATVNQLQTGKAKHPLIMVPKSVYKKWIKEIHQHFPEIAVNELGNFSEKDIGQYKNADGTYSFPENALNVCTYEALQKVTFKDETLDGQLRDDMMDSQSIFDYDENGNLVADTRSEREKAEAKEKIEKLIGKSAKAKDGAVYWEDLGIDHITVDELHNFKNVFSIPRNIGKSVRSTNETTKDYWGRTVKADDDPGQLSNEFQGLSGASSSRAMKLFAISQLIQAENNGKGFYGLSATPFNNSPVEIYNILSLCARNRLKELQIYNLQDFLREFAELKPDWKVDAKGNTTQSQTMKNFKNLTALQNLITEFIDKVDGEEAGVVRPRKQTHRPELDLTPLQKKIIEAEKMRMDGYFSKGFDGKPTGDVLVAMNNMRMATLSPSLIDPKFYADYASVYDDWEDPKLSDIVKESPKLQFVCDSVSKQYNERPGEGQVIYMPRGVEQYDYVKDYLVSKGMPADSIAFMDSSTTLENKERIKDDFNDPNGKIKVIIGSETIKEGVSLNGNSTTIYNTMLGWNPTETIQVEGRIWRQGNKQGITHVVYPLMNDSIDSMMMQKYDEKSSRLNALWSYKGDNLNVEDYDPEEVKFQLIKDPEKRANLKIMRESADLKKQHRLLGATYDNLYDSRRNHKTANDYVVMYESKLEAAQKEVDEKVAAVETYKENLEKAKKTLKTAEKAKDDDLIELAKTRVDKANTELGYAKDTADRAKSDFRQMNRTLKEYQNQKESIEKFWEKNGVMDPSKIDEKLEEVKQKMLNAQKEIDQLKERHDDYVKEATAQLAAEQAAMRHDTVEDVVDEVTGNIKRNLRPMDDALKAEIRAELEERYPHLKKSLPLFFIKNGRFLVRK